MSQRCETQACPAWRLCSRCARAKPWLSTRTRAHDGCCEGVRPSWLFRSDAAQQVFDTQARRETSVLMLDLAVHGVGMKSQAPVHV